MINSNSSLTALINPNCVKTMLIVTLRPIGVLTAPALRHLRQVHQGHFPHTLQDTREGKYRRLV